MPVFTDDDNPLTDSEWEQLNSVVTDIARSRLVGRRLIDIYGPLGAGIQTIVHDMNHPYRVLESIYLRIKRPGAICTLEPRKTARK